jgi:hypothetical protein
MTHEEFTEELEAGREEAQRRMQQMAALLGMAQPSGKPGRPPKNATYRFGGADQESQESDAASAVEALRD